MSKVNIKINHSNYQVEEGITILEACRLNGYDIPTLCHFKDLVESGACRVCVVEVKGMKNLQTACTYKVHEGLEVLTASPKVLKERKLNVELILSNHSKDCLSCAANGRCELQRVAEVVGARDQSKSGEKSRVTIDDLSPSLIRDTSKCVLCGRCIEACKKYQGIGILGFENRGFDTFVSPAANYSFNNVPCLYCAQCVQVCPTGALTVKESKELVYDALSSGKHVVVQVAPAVRVSLGEEFNLPKGEAVTGKMISALRKLGFDKIYDVNWSADLTIMEEGYELLNRVNNKGVLPMITSCCPGWVRYAEFNYGDILDHLSSCKSPHMMSGAILKSYYASRYNLDPKDIVVVSVMPCAAKKAEIVKPELVENGHKDVDIVLTTRELADMIKAASVEFTSLEESNWDQDLLGDYTGAGVIFGVTGGVMEAALRTVYAVLENKEYGPIEFKECRGLDNVKEASLMLHINGKETEVKIAIAHTMKAAKPLLDQIRNNCSPYTFIEIMACPGGCINGGGQSFDKPMLNPLNEKVKKELDVKYLLKARAKGLYQEDERQELRASHLNPQIKEVYSEFLKEPNSHLAHELLHTHYSKKDKYGE